MGYDQEPTRRNRIVVSTAPRAAVPKATRTRRTGMKPAILDAAIIVGTTLFTTLFLLFISGQLHDTTAGHLQPRPAVPQLAPLGQPTPPASQHASPSATPARSPATPTPTPVTGADLESDSAMQAEIRKRIAEDPSLASLRITATVTNSKVVLAGSVPTDELKDRIEKLVRAVKGVKDVDNQIVVFGGMQ